VNTKDRCFKLHPLARFDRRGDGVETRGPAAGRSTLLRLLTVAAAVGLAVATGIGISPAGATSSKEIAAAKAAVEQAMKPPTKIVQTVPLPRTPPKGKTVVCLADDNIPSDYQICTEGIGVAAKAIGWTDDNIYFDPSNPASLDSALSSALTKNPTAVINVGGQPISEYPATTLAQYKSAHVPIVVGNVDSLTPTKTLIGPVNSGLSSVEGGTILADWVIDVSKGNGDVLMVNVPAYSELNQVAVTVTQVLHKKCPGCSVQTVNITLPEISAGQLVPTTVNTLKANPNIKYVFFVTGSFGDGIVSALKIADLSGIDVGAQDMDPYGAAALQAHTEAAFTGGPAIPYLGFMDLDMALRNVETGAITSIGDQTAPIQLMTPANIGSTSIWNQPKNALQQFLKLWKVKS
jgi:ribose transport system substrate-binding protein